MNKGQLFAACLLNEVTNPGQNESQGLPTLCDRGGRRRNAGHWVARPVEREVGEEEGGAKWLAEALALEVVPFLSEEIGI